MRLADLSVTLDDGTGVVKDAEVVIECGERVLVSGESGTGKSTLVRAISGLWPWGRGTVEVARGAKLMLMPQRSYVPVGTLRKAVVYPEPANSKDDAKIAKALELVGLGTWSSPSTRRPLGTRRCRAGKSNASHSRKSSCTVPKSWCSTRLRRHWIRRVRID